MEQFDLITIGGATRDIMFYAKEGLVIRNPRPDPIRQWLLSFELGGKINIEKSFFTIGGGANNAAVALARLGLKTAAFLAIGADDNGQAISDNLKQNGVSTKFLKIIKEQPTGFSFILTSIKRHERTIFLYRGANNFLNFDAADFLKLRQIKNQWFYLSSVSGKNWLGVLDRLKKIISKSTKPQIKLAWNPGAMQLAAGKKRLLEFIKLTEVLIVNKDEAIELVLSDQRYRHPKIVFLNRVKNLLLILKAWGPKIVVVTDGAKGAYVYDGEKIYFSPAVNSKRQVVDLTGVGDAFGSSFVAGLILYQNDTERALKLALVNSASVTTAIGAQNILLSRKEAERAVSKTKFRIKKF